MAKNIFFNHLPLATMEASVVGGSEAEVLAVDIELKVVTIRSHRQNMPKTGPVGVSKMVLSSWWLGMCPGGRE